jgi:hypothetical protein
MTRDSGQGDPSVAGSLTEVLLTAASQASDAGLYEVAYHALAGAMHSAEEAGDRDRLATVREEALRQQSVVDAGAPEHRLSSRGGQQQGHQGWFDTLGVMASAASVRMRGTAAVEHAEQVRHEIPPAGETRAR